MKTYTTFEIEALINRFEKQKLPKIEWTHEAHLVVAIWYSVHYKPDKALLLVRDYITKHNTAVGTINSDTDGYHETITKFWLMLASDYIKNNQGNSITDLCTSFICSDKGKSDCLLMYYSEPVLFSVKARHQWVEPDLVNCYKV